MEENVRWNMKKLFVVLLIVLLAFTAVACREDTAEVKTEKEVRTYATNAKKELLDYDKSSYEATIDKATDDSLAYIPYCLTDEHYQLVEDFHQCIVLFILSDQIYNYQSEQYSMLQSDYSYYFSQSSYLKRKISQIEADYNKLINAAPEYIQIHFGSGQQWILDNYIAGLRQQCEDEISPYRLELQHLDEQYGPAAEAMEACSSLMESAKDAMDSLSIKYDELLAKLEELKPSSTPSPSPSPDGPSDGITI